jgi:tRNA(fMet)-specific endonuclease VapC
MLLLDSNILSAMYSGHPKILRALDETRDSDIATTIVNKVELLQGRMEYLLKANRGEDLIRAQGWLKETERLMAEIPIVPFDQVAAGEFDRLSQVASIRKMGRADLLIATIALANKATLVTRNFKDFQRVPGLRLVNWLD